jgi:Predicted membrane protein (DUF2142)
MRSGRLRAAIRRIPLPLGILLVVAVVLGVTWSVFSPFGQGPDEEQHFAYLQYFAETGHRPSATGPQSLSTEQGDTVNIFGLQPLIGNVYARPTTEPIERAQWRTFDAAVGKAQRSDGRGPNAQSPNPVLYYALMAIPYRVAVALGANVFDQLVAVRLANIVLFIAGLVFVWLLAVELLGGTFLSTVATASVALFPKLTELVATVSTEVLLFLCFTAAMYAAVRAIRHGPTVANVALLAIAAAAAPLTQGRGLALVPAAVLALALALQRHRPPLRRGLQLGGLMVGVLFAGAALLTLTSGGLGSSGGAAFGGAVAGAVPGHFTIGGFIDQTWQFYFHKLPFMGARLGPDYGFRQVFITTYFSSLFGFEVVLRDAIFNMIRVAVLAGLAWFAVALVVKRRALRANWQVVLALAGFLLAELLLLHVASYRQLLLNNGADPLITGRYLIALIALMGLAIAFCIATLPRRWGALAAGVIVAAIVALQIGTLGITIARFYA